MVGGGLFALLGLLLSGRLKEIFFAAVFEFFEESLLEFGISFDLLADLHKLLEVEAGFLGFALNVGDRLLLDAMGLLLGFGLLHLALGLLFVFVGCHQGVDEFVEGLVVDFYGFTLRGHHRITGRRLLFAGGRLMGILLLGGLVAFVCRSVTVFLGGIGGLFGRFEFRRLLFGRLGG